MRPAPAAATTRSTPISRRGRRMNAAATSTASTAGSTINSKRSRASFGGQCGGGPSTRQPDQNPPPTPRAAPTATPLRHGLPQNKSTAAAATKAATIACTIWIAWSWDMTVLRAGSVLLLRPLEAERDEDLVAQDLRELGRADAEVRPLQGELGGVAGPLGSGRERRLLAALDREGDRL